MSDGYRDTMSSGFDLAVIGAGYWGTAAVALAIRRGVPPNRIVQIAPLARDTGLPQGPMNPGRDPHIMPHRNGALRLSASWAASGHFSLGWFNGPWRRRAQRALEIAQTFEIGLRPVGAVVTTVQSRARQEPPKIKTDWWTFSPWSFLQLSHVWSFERAGSPVSTDLWISDLVYNVTPVENGWRIHVLDHVDSAPPYQASGRQIGATEARDVFAHRVVLAAGVGTDDILRQSGLSPLDVTPQPGAGIVLPVAPGSGRMNGEPVLLHHVNPYKHYSLRDWRARESPTIRTRVPQTMAQMSQTTEMIRLGDTVETPRVPYRASSIEKMIDMMRPYFSLSTEPSVKYGSYVLHGVRPVLADGPTVQRVLPGLVVATGGGRVGGVLSFWAAEEALRLLDLY
jgi:hypothetical protein